MAEVDISKITNSDKLVLQSTDPTDPKTITSVNQKVDGVADQYGRTIIYDGMLDSGEDMAVNLKVVEERYTYLAKVTADTQVKASAGFLHTVTISCNDAAPTAGSLIIYDNTAESGTQVFNHTFTTTPFVPFTLLFNCVMANGIYLGFTTTADVNVTVSYR